jgi:hypothetical protein
MLSSSTTSNFCQYEAVWFNSPLSEIQSKTSSTITETVDDNNSPLQEIQSKEQLISTRSANDYLIYENKRLIWFNNHRIDSLIESKRNDTEIDEQFFNENIRDNCIRILNNIKRLIKITEGDEQLKLMKNLTALASIQMDNM